MEKIQIAGASPEEKTRTERGAQNYDEEGGLKQIEGESEKTGRERWIIEKINEYLNKELSLLGIKEGVALPQENFHFLSQEVYKKFAASQKFAEGINAENIPAFYSSDYGAAYINKDQGTDLQRFVRLFHEAVHKASAVVAHTNLDKKISRRRLGYRITRNPNGGEGDAIRLYGFNEAVTETATREILSKHRNELEGTLATDEEKSDPKLFTYDTERYIIDLIIQKIAEADGEGREIVWNRIKRGLFTGEMMHLRQVEKIFGRKSLKMLSLLGTSGGKLSRKETTKKITAYFEADDTNMRQQIAEDLLGA
ncbi:MAG: hypothetical protein AAB897_03570 [Patescibacteria group bacterium]